MKFNKFKEITLSIILISFFLFIVLLKSSCITKGDIQENYHTYDEISSELNSIEENHTEISKLYEIGKTFENRSIFAMKISDNPTIEENETSLLFIGGIHANELVSVEMSIYLINHLIENYYSNVTLKKYVNNREIWILPIANPDGHVFVEETNGFWRKNRRDNGDGTFGVDLNRNFDYKWGIDDMTSNETNSNYYHGLEPFSENETRAIRDLVLTHNFTTSISFHSWGEYILYPWGYTIEETTKDDDLLREIAKAMAEFSNYDIKQSSEYYPAKGDSEDWLYSKGVLPFTIELGKEYAPEIFNGILIKNLKSCFYLIEIAENPEIVFHYEFDISSEKTNIYITNNSHLILDLSILNKGNTYNEILIEIDNLPSGWSYEIDNKLILLDGELKIITLKLNISEFHYKDNNNININISAISKDFRKNITIKINEILDSDEFINVNEPKYNENYSNLIIILIFIFFLLLVLLFKI